MKSGYLRYTFSSVWQVCFRYSLFCFVHEGRTQLLNLVATLCFLRHEELLYDKFWTICQSLRLVIPWSYSACPGSTSLTVGLPQLEASSNINCRYHSSTIRGEIALVASSNINCRYHSSTIHREMALVKKIYQCHFPAYSWRMVLTIFVWRCFALW